MEEKDNKAEELRKSHRKLIFTDVLDKWEARRKEQGLNKRSKKTVEMQLEFLIGAIAALDSLRPGDDCCMPDVLPLFAFSGRYIEFNNDEDGKE